LTDTETTAHPLM